MGSPLRRTTAQHRLTIQSVSDARLAGVTRQGAARSPDVLFDPSSVTVVGASSDPTKWGHILSRRALESCVGRPALLVNRRGSDVLGRRTHRTIVAARDEAGVPV